MKSSTSASAADPESRVADNGPITVVSSFSQASAVKEIRLSETVRNNPALHRFELDLDGQIAASYYQLNPGVITFTHIEVPKELEGHGIGSRLVRGALEEVRAQGLKVVPKCPFVSGYMAKHPEFNDLLL